MSKLGGDNIAGSNSIRGRAENDFYATPFEGTEGLVKKLNKCIMGRVWEPACGEGHISFALQNLCGDRITELRSTDLIQREDKFGIGVKGGVDFLEAPETEKGEWDCVITNPPFKYMKEFCDKGLEMVHTGGIVAMLGKIQFLEGQGRKAWFESNPPKWVFVFSKRLNPWRNGNSFDENGKPWSTVMCFAWFVWEKGYKGSPMIEWI